MDDSFSPLFPFWRPLGSSDSSFCGAGDFGVNGGDDGDGAYSGDFGVDGIDDGEMGPSSSLI